MTPLPLPVPALRGTARATAELLLVAVGIVLVRIAGAGALAAIGLPPLLGDGLTAVAVLGAYRLLVARLQHRPATEVAAGGVTAELGAGVLAGTALFGATAGLLWLTGTLHAHGPAQLAPVGRALGVAMLAAVVEELIVRGLLFRAIEGRFGSAWALGVSAAVFGILHLANPGATIVSALAIAFEAGLMLGAAYLVTRRLWLAIGLHFAWNATETALFGSPTSGEHVAGLLHTKLTGAHALSGGAFGVEGSIVAVDTCLAAALVMLAAARRRGNLTSRA